MSQLSLSELAKVRKVAEVSVTLKNEMKQSVVEEKLRTLNASIKKLLSKKDATVEIFVLKGVEASTQRQICINCSKPPSRQSDKSQEGCWLP